MNFYTLSIVIGVCVKKKEWFGIAQGLSYLSQVGLSIATPIVLTILGANLLVSNGILGNWFYLPAILLGMGAAVCSFITFSKYVLNKNQKTDKNRDLTVPDELRGKLE